MKTRSYFNIKQTIRGTTTMTGLHENIVLSKKINAINFIQISIVTFVILDEI